jgi:hypothetical protein
VARAPDSAVVGGKKALAGAVDSLLDAWITTADEQTAQGSPFLYARGNQRLLHLPLDPVLPGLGLPHQKFVAGRSMRDVEANALLKIRDPWGGMIANAEDA